ncbi:MAG: redoxin domain-containing protein [bacterium JZ-2024 1]
MAILRSGPGRFVFYRGKGILLSPSSLLFFLGQFVIPNVPNFPTKGKEVVVWYEIWNPKEVRYGSVSWKKGATIQFEREDVLVFYKFEAGDLVDDANGYGYYGWLNPPVQGAYHYLGNVYQRWNRREADGDVEEALKWYQKELEMFPLNKLAWVDYWLARKEKGEDLKKLQEEIRPKFEKLRYLQPEELYARIVLLDEIFENREEARVLAQTFRERFSDHPLVCAIYLNYSDELPVTLPSRCQNEWEYAWIFEPWIAKKLEEKKFSSVLKRVEEYFREYPIPRTPNITQLCIYAAQAAAELQDVSALERWLNFGLHLVDSPAFTYHYLWRHPFSRKAKYDEVKGALLAEVGNLYQKLNNLDKAIQTWSFALSYLKESETLFQVLRHMGDAYLEKNILDKALEMYLQALVLEPEEAVVAKVQDLWRRIYPKASPEGWKGEVKKRRITRYPIPEDLTLISLEGKRLRWKDLPKRVLVLNFWATWCPPCKKEIPQLNELPAKFPDVLFLAFTKEKPQTVQRFLQKMPFAYQIFPDATDVFKPFSIASIPVHIILDENRVVRYRLVGAQENLVQTLSDRIRSLLVDENRSSG